MDTFMFILDVVGTIAFAVTGALVAIEEDLDYYGIVFMGITTAIGGGILRDIIISLSIPESLIDPIPIIVAVATSLIVIIFAERISRIEGIITVIDAVGLAAFTATGCAVAVENGYPTYLVIVTLALLTGTFGGVMRDVFAHRIPVVFRKEIYAMASIFGASAYYVLCVWLHAPEPICAVAALLVTLAIRLIAVFNKLHLPHASAAEAVMDSTEKTLYNQPLTLENADTEIDFE